MTRITINLPLVDQRACTGCPYRTAEVCDMFFTKRGLRRTLRPVFRKNEWVFKRLPECIAATVEEVER